MDKLGTVLSALSDRTRRTIVHRLADGGPACVGDIAARFPTSLNAISKHIKVLEAAGLVRRRKEGRSSVLEFAGEPLREIIQWAHTYERYWQAHLDKLDAVFAKKGTRQ